QYPMDSSYCFSLSSKWLLEKDPSRLRLYERDNRYTGVRETSMVDVYSSQYASLAEVEHQLVSGKDMPFIHSEYDHSMGNALGNLNEYWQQIRSELKAQGGFIWDFKDQSVLMGTEEFTDNLSEASYLSYGGDWGDKLSDGSYCGNGIFFADGSASPKVSEVKHVYQDVQVYQVDEGYQFVNEFESRNLSEFDISYEVKADGEVISSEALSLSAKPHSAEVVQVNLPEDLDPYKTYTLDFYVRLKESTKYAEIGYELARNQFVLQKGSEPPYAQINQNSKFTVDEGDQEITIANERGKLVIDKNNGTITTYEFLGEAVFEENPHVNYLRATIENDFVEGKSIYEESLKDAYKGVVISQGITSIDVQDSQVNVYLEGYLSDQKSFVSFLYSYYMDGTLGIESSFVASTQMSGEFPVVGFEMKLPKDYQAVTYFGKGPDENYSDRNTGSYFDTYETTVWDMCMSKYLRPQENGYRSEVMNFSISNGTKKVEIYSNQMGFSVSPYRVNQLEEAQHWYELEES
ncbi:MAG: DUF4981 domain-containing protein, partial [Erysipelotrichaceae bacterium]|nr:DUF4981 domain-containing protein [Erysipelotrichaceae bacterium]